MFKKQQACLFVFKDKDIFKVFSRWELEEGCTAILREQSSKTFIDILKIDTKIETYQSFL